MLPLWPTVRATGGDILMLKALPSTLVVEFDDIYTSSFTSIL
jgi:hypothetical protein